jgi:hypothetical protein
VSNRKPIKQNIDDLVVIETKIIEPTQVQVGRPSKFAKKLNTKITLAFSDGQLKEIDKRAKELGFSVRLDYIRKFFRTDIPNFDEL